MSITIARTPKPGDRVRLVDDNGSQLVTVDHIDQTTMNGLRTFDYRKDGTMAQHWAYVADIKEIVT